MTYAVITTGGKQYRVAKGDVIQVEKVDVEAGNTIDFDKVLMIKHDDDVNIGAPYLEGHKVAGKVIEHLRGKKIEILKFRRRKNYLRHYGHRQSYTTVEITDIH